MNPMVKKQFDLIEDQIEKVRERLQEIEAGADRQQDEKDDLRRQDWAHRKKLTTLDRIAQDYDRLADENTALREERAALKTHLDRILSHTKALHNSYRP